LIENQGVLISLENNSINRVFDMRDILEELMSEEIEIEELPEQRPRSMAYLMGEFEADLAVPQENIVVSGQVQYHHFLSSK
jgi:hypothetical protein